MVFEDAEVRDRMKKKRDTKVLTNACFSALNHTEGLMSAENSIKSKTSQPITSENNAVIMLDHPGNRSHAFDVETAEP